MNSTQIFEIAAYTLPAIITGGVAYIVINRFFINEDKRRRYELIKENQKQALPIRLQAYERIVFRTHKSGAATIASATKWTRSAELCYAFSTHYTNRIRTQYYPANLYI